MPGRPVGIPGARILETWLTPLWLDLLQARQSPLASGEQSRNHVASSSMSFSSVESVRPQRCACIGVLCLDCLKKIIEVWKIGFKIKYNSTLYFFQSSFMDILQHDLSGCPYNFQS